jgi:hypothetical protein
MINPFKTDKFPYIVGILFAIIGWGIVHITDRLTKAPLVEYNIDKLVIQDTTWLTYHIRNLTNDKSFTDNNFLIGTDGTLNKIVGDSVLVDAPIQIDRKKDSAHKENQSFQYHLSVFQPGTILHIKIAKLGKTIPKLRYSSLTTVWLLETTSYTRLVRNEFDILLWLTIACAGLIILYIIIPKNVVKE